MHWIVALAFIVQSFLWATPTLAQPIVGHQTVVTTTWIEEWNPNTHRWERVSAVEKKERPRSDASSAPRAQTPEIGLAARRAGRFTQPSTKSALQRALAQYGPFVVIDERRAAIVGSTDAASLRHFDRMMRDFPGLATLEMVEAPGTSNDVTNLEIGRRIRAHGLSTHVPKGGSVRSGAVELFLAGVDRTIEVGALFAVHSWLDNSGREPHDFAPDAPANQLYIDYYMEMGMSEARARAFYAMTNSVPHHSAKWLRAHEMERWIKPESAFWQQAVRLKPQPTQIDLNQPMSEEHAPMIAYSDLSSVALAWSSVTLTQAFLDS